MKLSTILVPALVALYATSPALAQTGATDTAKKTAAPNFSIRNARVVMPNEQQKPIDNANVTFAAQFAGAYPITVAGPDVDMSTISNIQQLTFGGENLAPSFSPDGKHIVFEARSFADVTCRQAFVMTADGKDPHRISTGNGEAMNGMFTAKGNRIVFTSTHEKLGGVCPPITDYELQYGISINGLHDLYVVDSSGKIEAITNDGKFYDGMATISPDNKHVVFSSTRQGDIDLYYLDLVKNEITQLTTSEGFDGMARFSPNGKKIVLSASRPVGEAVASYRANLINGNVNVDACELYLIDLETRTMDPLTSNGARNVNASFSPNGDYLIFASNMHDTTRNDMAIYTLRLSDNQVVQRINSPSASEEYPVWSPNGTKVAYVSNRKVKNRNERNIYVADWAK